MFLRHISGTQPYWQTFMYEVVAMVKQLGIPTWFMMLSCADVRWPELLQIVARTQGNNITEDEVEALSPRLARSAGRGSKARGRGC